MQNDLISRSYVDAELQKAQKSLEANSDYVWARNQGHHKGLAWARRIVQDAPGAESETVVHGRWLTSSDVPDTLICSACGRRYDMYFFDQKNMPYCLCGCKMDENTDVYVCERSVDTVSVVRCKHRGSSYSCPMRKLVIPGNGPGSYEDCTEDDGFCHMGEKKDGGTEG